jgi:hypothetical protein
LWAGRVGGELAPEVWDFLHADDAELLPYDLQATLVHAQRLHAAAILDAAKYLGWRAYHVRNSKAGIIQGDAGFPDLVLARKGRVLFVELKSEKGKLTPAQWAWLDDLGSAPRAIRPPDLDGFLESLR